MTIDTAKLRELAEKVALDVRIGEAGQTADDWPIRHDEAGDLAAAVLALLDENARLREALAEAIEQFDELCPPSNAFTLARRAVRRCAMTGAWDGVPLNPERDGWHWLSRGGMSPFPWLWLAPTDIEPGCAWGNGDGRELTVQDAAELWAYHGPCLTPADHAAALDATWQAACEAMREEAARTAKVAWLSAPYDEIADADAMNTVCVHAEEIIRALPTPERPR